MRRVLDLAIVGMGVVTFCSQGRALAEAKTRVVHFPADRSMGVLYVLDWNLLNVIQDAPPAWERLCEAAGDVTVPAGKALRLDLSKEAGPGGAV